MMPFIFYAHKPKALKLAKWFHQGCLRRHVKCRIAQHTVPVPDHIGVFYGVTPDTYPAFRYYMAEGRALYLDNGWLSSPERVSFRFTWNGAQSMLRDMPRREDWESITMPLPPITHAPVPNRALLILQSRPYFECLRLGYSRDQWEMVTRQMLERKGYDVVRREKPTTKDHGQPNFFDQLATAEIVVSLNSASTVKALRYGIPAFCILDSTPSPLAPARVPVAGRAAPPNREQVNDMCARLHSYEVTPEEIYMGHALDRMTSVPPELRRGYWYARD